MPALVGIVVVVVAAVVFFFRIPARVVARRRELRCPGHAWRLRERWKAALRPRARSARGVLCCEGRDVTFCETREKTLLLSLHSSRLD